MNNNQALAQSFGQKIAVLVVVAVASIQVACSRSSFDAGMAKEPKVVPDSNSISASKSTIAVTTDQFADGASAAEVTITLRTGESEPVVGLQMSLEVSGSNNVVTSCSVSDSHGVSRCRIYSTTAETKTVKAVGEIVLVANTRFIEQLSSSSAFQVVSSSVDDEVSPSGPRLVATAGIIESDAQLRDQNGNVIVYSLILGSVLGE